MPKGNVIIFSYVYILMMSLLYFTHFAKPYHTASCLPPAAHKLQIQICEENTSMNNKQ